MSTSFIAFIVDSNPFSKTVNRCKQSICSILFSLFFSSLNSFQLANNKSQGVDAKVVLIFYLKFILFFSFVHRIRLSITPNRSNDMDLIIIIKKYVHSVQFSDHRNSSQNILLYTVHTKSRNSGFHSDRYTDDFSRQLCLIYVELVYVQLSIL